MSIDAHICFASSQPLTHSRHTLPSLCSGQNHLRPRPVRRRLRATWYSEASPEPTTESTTEPPSTDAEPTLPLSKSPISTYLVQALRSVAELPASEWDILAASGTRSPFLKHFWLRCLEESGCASADTGWTPHHLVVREQATEQVVAVAPAYLKYHSMGEFVFDHDWADACYGAGMEYYPKLLLAVPFTPATGRRVLTRPDFQAKERKVVLDVVAKALKQLVERLRISSVHVNFCEADEVEALAAAGFLHRKGVQYHFTNYKKGKDAIADLEKLVEGKGDVEGYAGVEEKEREPYRDFEDYLGEFKSKRRIKMRRERTSVRDDAGLEVEVLRGEQIDESIMETVFHIYKSTIEKQLYGRQYLTKRFFRMLIGCEDFKQCICLVLAKRKESGEVIGGTFNVVGEGDGGAFYGRYWGCMEEVRYLHFEACYYAAIEYCIENGLGRMEPGAGGGDFKYMRGFEPAVTNSMHYLRDSRLSNAVERYLQVEALQVDYAVHKMKQVSAIRSKSIKKGEELR